MKYRTPLTAVAQERLGGIVQPGDTAVDATVGNGHDTLFLAQRVGPQGQVWGFDVQAQALQTAGDQLHAAGFAPRVQLIQQGHQHLSDVLPDRVRGHVAAVMFNLGYLPGSDKRLTTQADTTLTALHASLAWLRPGGVLSVLAYRGHAGGLQEADRVLDWMTSHADQLRMEIIESPGPVLYLAGKTT